jgi:hypothetical protein
MVMESNPAPVTSTITAYSRNRYYYVITSIDDCLYLQSDKTVCKVGALKTIDED